MGYLLNFVLFDLGFWDVLFDFSLDSDLLLCVLVYIFLSPLATVFIYTLYPFSHRFVTLRIRYPQARCSGLGAPNPANWCGTCRIGSIVTRREAVE